MGLTGQYGRTSYTLVIDNFYINLSQGLRLNASALLQLPDNGGKAIRLAFAGENVALNGPSDNRLTLVGPKVLDLGQGQQLRLAADAHNYLELGCGEVKAVHLEGQLLSTEADPSEATPAARMLVVSSAADLQDLSAAARRMALTDARNPTIRHWQVTPNPNDGRFELRAQLGSQSPLLVRIYDPLGKQVYQQTWNHTQEVRQTLQLPDQAPAGLYLVWLLADKESQLIKLLVNR
jgi:hypothetical protein